MQQKLNDMVIFWQMGKTSRKAKIPLSEFQVTISKNPLIKNKQS